MLFLVDISVFHFPFYFNWISKEKKKKIMLHLIAFLACIFEIYYINSEYAYACVSC